MPLLPGMTAPVSDVAQVAAFAREHGLPVAIKAASGGGGRGVTVARSAAEIPGACARAMHAAAAAGGRAECFAERYLDQARHMETQCLADPHGDVAVISTRDCSLQRRHQKIVEEAPAPFLPADLDARLRAVSKAILRAAGYVGAATCEFLLGQDGTLAFLEANARLAVAHPVSEEVTGLDLVRETFRLAEGEALGYGDPPVRGHALQFRIYAEDPDRGFSPARGTVRDLASPSGPGVRLDSGVGAGLGGRPGVRHAAGQADRDRGVPRRGAAAGPPGAARVRGGRAGDQPAVPPRPGHRRGVRAARSRPAVLRSHGLDRVQGRGPRHRATEARAHRHRLHPRPRRPPARRPPPGLAPRQHGGRLPAPLIGEEVTRLDLRQPAGQLLQVLLALLHFGEGVLLGPALPADLVKQSGAALGELVVLLAPVGLEARHDRLVYLRRPKPRRSARTRSRPAGESRPATAPRNSACGAVSGSTQALLTIVVAPAARRRRHSATRALDGDLGSWARRSSQLDGQPSASIQMQHLFHA